MVWYGWCFVVGMKINTTIFFLFSDSASPCLQSTRLRHSIQRNRMNLIPRYSCVPATQPTCDAVMSTPRSGLLIPSVEVTVVQAPGWPCVAALCLYLSVGRVSWLGYVLPAIYCRSQPCQPRRCNRMHEDRRILHD